MARDDTNLETARPASAHGQGDAAAGQCTKTESGTGKDNRTAAAEQKTALGAMRQGKDIHQLGFKEPQIVGGSDCKLPPAKHEESAKEPEKAKATFEDKMKPLPVPIEPYLQSATVKPEDVDDGRTKVVKNEKGKFQVDFGVLQFSSREDLQNFQDWLNKKVPPDGKPETDDRRTALILKVAMADASRMSTSPSEQLNTAYEKLNAMRSSMAAIMPEKGYHLDAGLANAEHFLETAHRVAGTPFDGEASDFGGQLWRGKWSSGFWEATSGTYNKLKQWGILSGSKSENQHKWELKGIEYGGKAYDVQHPAK